MDKDERHEMNEQARVEDNRPAFITDEHLDYLDSLSEGGETNMFGAGVHLMREFKLISPVAREILYYWLNR